jgi:hypothetical protein
MTISQIINGRVLVITPSINDYTKHQYAHISILKYFASHFYTNLIVKRYYVNFNFDSSLFDTSHPLGSL